MKYLVLLLIFISQVALAKDKAIIIDALDIIRYSPQKYKGEISHNMRDNYGRSTSYYLTRNTTQVLIALSRDFDVYILKDSKSRDVNRLISRFDLEDYGIKDEFYRSIDKDIKDQYSKILYFGNSDENFSAIKLPYAYYYFKTLKDAKDAYNDLRSREQKKYGNYYPKTESELNQLDQNLQTILNNAIQVVFDLNQTPNINLMDAKDLLQSGHTIKESTHRVKFRNKNISKIDGCYIVSNWSRQNTLKIDLKSCEKHLRLKYTYDFLRDENEKGVCVQKINNHFHTEVMNQICLEDLEIKKDLKKAWDIQNDKAIGCKLSYRNILIDQYPPMDDQCQKDSRLKKTWKWDSANGKVTSCTLYAETGSSWIIRRTEKYIIKSEKLEDCLDTSIYKGLSTGLKYSAVNNIANGCQVTDKGGNYIQDTNIEKCHLKLPYEYKPINSQGKLTGCTKNNGDIIIQKYTDLDKCTTYLNLKTVLKYKYNEDKTQIISCEKRYSDGSFITNVSPTKCGAEKRLVKDDSNTFISGCYFVNLENGLPIDKLDISECQTSYTNNHAFRLNDNNFKTSGCYIKDNSSHLPILDIPQDYNECYLDSTLKYHTYFAWKEKTQNDCYSFYYDDQVGLLYQIEKVESNLCTDMHFFQNKEIKTYHIRNANELNMNKSISELTDDATNPWVKLALALKDYYKELIIVTDREISTFNYRSGNDLSGNGLKPITYRPHNTYSKIAVDYANEWMDTFFKYTPQENGWVGYGLYAANNPVHSNSYGDHLVQINLPKGSRLLDIRLMYEKHFPIPEKLFKEFKELFITYDKHKDGIYYLDKNTFAKKKHGHYALSVLMKILKINSIIYNWNYRSFPKYTFPDVCDGNMTYATFVHINTTMNKDTVTLFSPNLTEAPTKKEAQKYYDLQLLNQFFSRSTSDSAKGFTRSFSPDNYYQDLNKRITPRLDDIFGCSARYQNDHAKKSNN